MMDCPTLSPRQASKLSDLTWKVGSTNYRFASRLRSGGEAFLFQLLGPDGSVGAYLRFLKRQFATPARIDRTSWLIGQRLPSVSPVFLGAPYAWASTYEHGRPNGFEDDFTATLHHCVPGCSWAEVKAASERCGSPLPVANRRIEIAKDLIAQFATLESLGITHGDPSDANFLVDVSNGEGKLIDFDAFVAHSHTLKFSTLSVSEGGVRGTPGYIPPDLECNASVEACPYSDRFGRDMLLLEILGFQAGDPIDASPVYWEDTCQLLDAVRPLARQVNLTYLNDSAVFSLSEDQRPSSKDLAIAVGCRMPTVHAT